MSLDKGKANVFVRGKHTLFMFTAIKPDGSERDANLAREQLATILNVPLVRVVPNHDYESKPEDAAYVFRFKAALPARVYNHSLETDERGKFINKGKFIDKKVVFHFPEEVKETPQRQGKPLEAMPGLEEDEPEVKAPNAMPADTTELILRLIDRQDKQAEQIQMLAEIIGKMALQGRI